MKFKKSENKFRHMQMENSINFYHSSNEDLSNLNQTNDYLNDSQMMNSNLKDNSRRYRTLFNRDQIKTLEEEFSKDKYISRPKRSDLAQQLNLRESTIKIWFQNRRMKFKRQKMGLTWPYPTDPHFSTYLFAAVSTYSQHRQQLEQWHQQKIFENCKMPTSLNSSVPSTLEQAKTPTLSTSISNLLPSTAAVPSLFVNTPILPNPLAELSYPKTIQNETQSTHPTNSSFNNFQPYLQPDLPYNLMLRSLGLNAAASATNFANNNSNQSAQQTNINQLSTENSFTPGLLNQLRELSENVQMGINNQSSTNENNLKLQTDSTNRKNQQPINPSLNCLEARSSSSASNSSESSSQLLLETSNANNHYNNSSPSSSSSPLSGHETNNQSQNTANLSLNNLNQINIPKHEKKNLPVDFAKNFMFSMNVLNQNKNCTTQNFSNNSSPERTPTNSPNYKNNLKDELSAIERFNSVFNQANLSTEELLKANLTCGSFFNGTKPLFQPYLTNQN